MPILGLFYLGISKQKQLVQGQMQQLFLAWVKSRPKDESSTLVELGFHLRCARPSGAVS